MTATESFKYDMPDITPEEYQEVERIEGYYLVVATLGAPEITRSGLILPGDSRDAAQNKAHMGVVLAIGPTCWQGKGFAGFHGDYLPGDIISYSNFAGYPHDIINSKGARVRVRIIRDEDVLSKVYDTSRIAMTYDN